MAIIINNLSVSAVSSDAELYAIWPHIREGIAAIENKCEGMFHRPEDFYHEIKIGKLQLLIAIAIDTNEYQGFALTYETQYPDGKGLHIMAMRHISGDDDFMDDCFEAVSAMAKATGIRRISFSSSRKGWQKRMTEFKPVAVLTYYERAL